MRALRPMVLVAVLVTATSAPAAATPPPQAGLGGGGTVPGGSVISLPAGTRTPAVHLLFADDPAGGPVAVALRAEAPRGIGIEPDRRDAWAPPGERAEVRFAISVDEAVPPGDHPVTVQLARTDVRPATGAVTYVPAIDRRFTVRVTGDAGRVLVAARSRSTGRPATGVLSLAAVLPGDRRIEVARHDGARLDARVSPGTYEASFLFGGSRRASQRITVAPSEVEDVTLDVDTVVFTHASAGPQLEDGRVAVVDLRAAVHNALGPVPGPVVLRAHVRRDGELVDAVELDTLAELSPGVTEESLPYRPAGGFAEGDYTVEFELDTPGFSLAGPDAAFTIGGPSSAGRAGTVVVAVLAGCSVVLLVWQARRT